MRYGVFGDIHSNLSAYRAVLDALESDGVEGYLCLGDIVGYGADAAECVAITQTQDGVSARVRLENGAEQPVAAAWAIAAVPSRKGITRSLRW